MTKYRREPDDRVVQAGFLVEDREGQLPGERQVVRRRAADGGLLRRLVQVHDPGHRRRAGAHGVHGRRFRLGQQRRAGQGLPGERRQRRRGRRPDDHRRHTKLHHSAVGKNEL